MLKKPDWLRVPYKDNINIDFMTELLKELKLNTVCIEADCPNRPECFSEKTATFMILGTNCTRRCGFCNVGFGVPRPADEKEPERIAAAVKKLNLGYVVITSVTRDDLPDGGAGHFSNVLKAIHKTIPDTLVEVLIPDLTVLKIITDESPAVVGHNIETVESLYASVRPDAGYNRSLDVLRNIKKLDPCIVTKSGIMLGLGETRSEVLRTFDDLLDTGCQILTIGQYLSPGRRNLRVQEYIKPHIFDEYGDIARKKGFRFVTAAPLVRSSYRVGRIKNDEKHTLF